MAEDEAAKQEDQQENTTPQASPPASQSEPRQQTPEESKKELEDAIKGSTQVLVKATTTLTLFPDTLVVDRAKLTVTKRSFIRVAEVMSMRIEDILNVTATVGPFFGNVKIMSRVMSHDQSDTVGRFWRKDAERIKRITQGYIIALQREIDCNALETKELAEMLEKLGTDDHPQTVDGL